MELLKKEEIKGPEEFRDQEWYYNTLLPYLDKKNKEIDFQNERYLKQGIPFWSVLLEKGKKYHGRADGEFEIKTYNNELYLTPLFCCDFGEVLEN